MLPDLLQRLKQRVLLPQLAIASVLGLTALLWLVGAPFLQDLAIPKAPALAVLLAASAPGIVRWALRTAAKHRHVRALAVLVLLGTCTQIALHGLVQEGLEQSLHRITQGHGEFLRVAAARRGRMRETLTQYDELVARGELGSFPAAKPPGALGAYMLLDKLAQAPGVQWLLGPVLSKARAVLDPPRIPESAALGVVLLPLLTFLAIVPLVWLGRSLYGDPRAGYGAALIGYGSPALLLVDLHLDGALYPVLTLLALALAAHATLKHRPLFALLGGMVALLGIYCTFALLPVLALGLGVTLLPSLERLYERAGLRAVTRPLVHALAFCLGAGLALFLLIAILDFSPGRRFDGALAFHAHWKRDLPRASWRWLSLAEFALYLATPLACAVLMEVACSVRSLLRGKLLLVPSLFSLGVFVTLLLLAFLQGTNEVARLWLFMVPLLALSVAGGLHARLVPAASRNLMLWLCAAQASLAVLMKVCQPW